MPSGAKTLGSTAGMQVAVGHEKDISRWMSWLTPWVCRLLFAALLVWGAVSHYLYLHDSPLDLSGDEAQYWDWSRQLGWSYYSKGPLVAWIIRLSTEIFGSTMPAVRYPAMVLAVGTSICTYWLVVKLFKSDRLALGTGLLYHFIPVFIAGSILMTIDPPFFFCWALATCLAVKGLFDGSRWVWPVVGLILGAGFLTKYAMLLWWVGLGIFLLIDRPSRRWLRSGWFWSMPVIALACTAPVVYWNAQHHWVSLLHVKEQTGTGFRWSNPLEFLGGQVAILGLSLAIIMAGAVIYAVRLRVGDRESSDTMASGSDRSDRDHLRAVRYLLSIGLSFFAIVFVDSFRSKIQPNWPAPAYFTLMILSAYFLSIRLGRGCPHKWWWRGNLLFMVVVGVVMAPLVHDFSILYPYLDRLDHVRKVFGAKHPLTVRQIDPTYKLRGWQELGQVVGLELRAMEPGSFILADDYQTTAELAFYAPGQPKTYYGGSYFKQSPSRFSQYDMWPDRSLAPADTTLIGRDAVYVGYMRQDLREAFAHVQQLPDFVFRVDGVEVRRFFIWKLSDFRGLARSSAQGRF